MRQHLRRNLARRLKTDDGYTLTEMLVVIGIIGLIAAVLTPGLMGQMGRARSRAAQLQLETIMTSIEMFQADVGRYPTPEEGLFVLVHAPDDLEGWTGPYVRDSKALKDPWGRPILYNADAEHQRFFVESLGGDGQRGGTGADRDLRAPGAE
jgi:general secretion pathway protein G